MWSSHVLRFLYESLNSWVISGFILFQVKEIMSTLSTYMGTINPTKIIQALSSYFQCFSQLENLLWICFWVLLGGWLVLFYAVTRMHHFVWDTEGKYKRQHLDCIWDPSCLFNMYRWANVCRCRCCEWAVLTHRAFLEFKFRWSVVFMTVSVCCKT